MNFTKELMITGFETKTRKDNTTYQIVHVLMDNGQTCSLMYKGEYPLANIKVMDKYQIDFNVVIDKYGTRIDIADIAPGVVANAK